MLLVSLAFSVTISALDVRVDAPPECPSRNELATEIDVLLPGELTDDASATLEVARVSSGFAAKLEVTTRNGVQRRDLHATDCNTLFEAAALVVAVGLDPMMVAQAVRPSLQQPSPPPTPAPRLPAPPPLPSSDPPVSASSPSQPQPPPPAPSRQIEPRRTLWSAGVQLGGGVAAGLADGVSGQASGGAAFARNALRIELGAHYESPREVSHPEDASAGARVDFVAGRAGICWAPVRDAFVLNLCGGGVAGIARAEGRGLATPRTARAGWFALDATARALWRPRWWLALGGGLAVLASVQRPSFAIDDFATSLMQVGAVGLIAGPVVQFTFFDESRSERR